jgi:hypothetical protein
MDRYFNVEIKNRMETIKKLKPAGDSTMINIAGIDKEINNIILLSKDIENIQASVSKANTFFLALATTYKINDSDFTKINTAMHVDEISSVLKQNELSFLNQVIFKLNPKASPLYTAQ